MAGGKARLLRMHAGAVQGVDLYGPLVEGKESPRRCAVAALYLSCALVTRRWKLEYYLEEGRSGSMR